MSIVFADLGLHLGVLNALLFRGDLDAADLVALVESTRPDGPDDGYPGPGPRLRESLKLLHSVAVPVDAVARIEWLTFDGGNEIYLLVEQTLDVDTGGESDDYNVGSLAGIGALTGLQSLSLDGHGYHPQPLDLRPLTGLSALRELVLTGECTGLDVLSTLPGLRELDIRLARLGDDDVTVALENRGVTVHRRGR